MSLLKFCCVLLLVLTTTYFSYSQSPYKKYVLRENPEVALSSMCILEDSISIKLQEQFLPLIKDEVKKNNKLLVARFYFEIYGSNNKLKCSSIYSNVELDSSFIRNIEISFERFNYTHSSDCKYLLPIRLDIRK